MTLETTLKKIKQLKVDYDSLLLSKDIDARYQTFLKQLEAIVDDTEPAFKEEIADELTKKLNLIIRHALQKKLALVKTEVPVEHTDAIRYRLTKEDIEP